MPRADNIPASMALLKPLIIGPTKSGKTDWAMRAAEAGFNVLYFDGDIATQTIAQLSPEGKKRLYLMEIGDRLVGDSFEPRMIKTLAAFFTATRMLWNDAKQREYSATKDEHNEDGTCVDEIWELRPSHFDHNWVWVLDSWTTAAYSAMLDKANSQGIDLGDIEKADQGIYAGAGNRLTNILATIRSARCHVVVVAHPSQFEKTKSPTNVRAGDVKAKDRIVEWTKMIPASSSNPHGFKMGKDFTDIGWMDVSIAGRRELNFKLTGDRISGGHLESKGDPRGDHRFVDLIKKIGGAVPDGQQGLGSGLTIYAPNTFKPASPASKKNLLAGAPKTHEPLQASTEVKPLKGLAGIGGLPRAISPT